MLRTALFAAALGLTPLLHAAPLTVYTANPASLIEQLAADFKADTGVDVNVFQSTTGQLMARLEAERSNPLADVVISASWDSAKALADEGLLLDYRSPNAEHVPENLKTNNYVAQGATALALVWNSDSQAPRPEDWSDLVKAPYRDQVTMPDPVQSGAAFELLSGLISANGEEETWKLIQQLQDNGMLVAGPNARALNPVLQGAKSVVFGAVDYVSLGQKAEGEHIDVVFPKSGTVVSARPMMILKSSKMPDDAKRFVDYVLSEKGQQRVAEAYLMPARTDIKVDRPGLNDMTLIDVDSEAMNRQRDQILARFRSITER
jgi:iron(III) transport system substrate-binding protein